MKLRNKILDKDDIMVNITEKIKGKSLELKEEFDKFFRLFELLDKKINENNLSNVIINILKIFQQDLNLEIEKNITKWTYFQEMKLQVVL